MKKVAGKLVSVITAGVVALGFSVASVAQAPNVIFNNIFDLNGTGDGPGGYIFSEVYGDLSRGVLSGDASTWTMAPNIGYHQDTCPGDAFWCDNGGAGPGGNKWVEASMFNETLIPASGSPSVENFTACVDASGLAAPYAVTTAFIKVFSTSYQLFGEVYGPICGALNIDILGDVDVIVQKGFVFQGPNANPAADNGSAVAYIGATSLPGSGAPSGPLDPTAIPVLPLWALLALTAVVGFFGSRGLGRRK